MEIGLLTQKQLQSIELAGKSRVALWDGGVSAGKTITANAAWLNFVLNGPPGNLLMVSKSLHQLRANVWGSLVDMVGKKYCRAVWGDSKGYIFDREIWFRGAPDAESIDNIQGMSLVGVYLDELTQLGGTGGERYWGMAQTRARQDGAHIFATTNPQGPLHWLKTGTIDQAQWTIDTDGTYIENPDVDPSLKIARFSFTMEDNPYLSEEYKESQRNAYLHTPLFYDRYILGKWVAADGAIYPQLDLNAGGKHVKPWDKDEYSFLKYHTLTIDYGATNPTHATFGAVKLGEKADGSDAKVVVLAECRLTDTTLTTAQQAAHIWKWIQEVYKALGIRASIDFLKVYIDPAAAAFKNSWRVETGRAGRNADNKVLPGIADVSVLIGEERIVFIDGEVPWLLKELAGYVWDQTAAEAGIDKPVKKDDHGADALRYLVRAIRQYLGLRSRMHEDES